MAKDIRFMLLIMYYTGCRPSEALALCRNDIDLNQGYIHINHAIGSDEESTRTITRTKTPESIRIIPIADDLRPILEELIEYSSSEPLLLSKDGKPYEINYVSDYIHRISKKCGIPFNAYMLRHLFSTDLFKKGINPIVIRDLMGHSSAQMSSDYATSDDDDKIQALNNRK